MVNTINLNGINKKEHTILLKLTYTRKEKLMTIDFEKDQENVLQKTTNIQSLADQVEKLEALQKRLELQEDNMKNTKN